MKLNAISKTSERFISDNSPLILTAIGVVGTVATAVLAAKAGVKSGTELEYERFEHLSDGNLELTNLTTKHKIEATWKNYVPTVGAGSLTVASIIMAQRINMKRAAGLAAAYVIADKQFGEYKEKALEKLGVKADDKIKADIAQENVTANPPQDKQIILAGGDVLFQDSYSGRYFRSSIEKVRSAQNDANRELLKWFRLSLSDFYVHLGLDQTGFSDEIGWNMDKPIDLSFSAVVTDSGEPCIVLNYAVAPFREYMEFHARNSLDL